MDLFKSIVEMFINKKRLIGWIAGLLFASGAAYVGMSSQEFKEAVCVAAPAQPQSVEVKK